MNMYTDDYFQALPPTAVYKAAADNRAKHTLLFELNPEPNDDDLQFEMELYNTHPKKRQYVAATDQANRFKANDLSLKKIIDYVSQSGLTIQSHEENREVSVTGTLEQLGKLLGITFHLYQDEDGCTFLAYHGAIKLPTDLRPYITHIEGLNDGLKHGHIPSKHLKLADDLNEASPVRRFSLKTAPSTDAKAGELPQGYSPADLTQMYRFPDNQGEGQTVGIIALGGTFNQNDLNIFCKNFKLSVPELDIVGDEPWQNPQDKTVNDLEVNMDVQLVAGMVPKAKIVLYYAHTFEEGFQAVLNDHEHDVSVVSTSWANGENYVSQSERAQQLLLIRHLSMRGITVLAASGDDGIYQISSNRKLPGINLPAGFAQVIACGGTTLYKNGTEQVWNEDSHASGGAFSNIYQAPTFQYEALTHYATQYPYYSKQTCATPDLAVNASVTHHNLMIYNGHPFFAAGTSAATPILAGLIARLNTALGYRLGYINSFLYQLMGSSAFNSHIPGNNGLPASQGWDPCTGLGSPNGVNLLNLIKETEAHWS